MSGSRTRDTGEIGSFPGILVRCRFGEPDDIRTQPTRITDHQPGNPWGRPNTIAPGAHCHGSVRPGRRVVRRARRVPRLRFRGPVPVRVRLRRAEPRAHGARDARGGRRESRGRGGRVRAAGVPDAGGRAQQTGTDGAVAVAVEFVREHGAAASGRPVVARWPRFADGGRGGRGRGARGAVRADVRGPRADGGRDVDAGRAAEPRAGAADQRDGAAAGRRAAR